MDGADGWGSNSSCRREVLPLDDAPVTKALAKDPPSPVEVGVIWGGDRCLHPRRRTNCEAVLDLQVRFPENWGDSLSCCRNVLCLTDCWMLSCTVQISNPFWERQLLK